MYPQGAGSKILKFSKMSLGTTSTTPGSGSSYSTLNTPMARGGSIRITSNAQLARMESLKTPTARGGSSSMMFTSPRASTVSTLSRQDFVLP